jgi:hypothetical protein
MKHPAMKPVVEASMFGLLTSTRDFTQADVFYAEENSYMSRKLLNPSQRNLVMITLQALEIFMRETVTDLSTQEQGILYQQKSTLSRQQLEQIETLRNEVLHEIDKLAKALALPSETRDIRSRLQGHLAAMMSDLYDIAAEKLVGYGEVAPELSPVLDPPVLHLIQLVRQMMGILSHVEGGQEEQDV